MQEIVDSSRRMANPVSIVQAIINLALKIKENVETFRHNREDCRKIGELVATVRDVAEGLRKTTEKEDGGTLVGGALKALKQALERAWDLVVACQRKNAVLRALDADAIAVKLRRVYLDVSLNLSAVVLANGAYNTSKLADINGIVAALRADVACNNRMLAKILEIVAALPDALLHLQQQVATLVQSFSDSTDEYYYQNESTRETKKTDDVARYDYTYSSSYASPKAQTTALACPSSLARTEPQQITLSQLSHSYYDDYKTRTYDGYQGAQRQHIVVPCDQQRYGAAGSLGPSSKSDSFYFYCLEQQWFRSVADAGWASRRGWNNEDGDVHEDLMVILRFATVIYE